MTRQTTG